MKRLDKANMLIINEVIFVAIACYDDLERIVVRDDRQELKDFLSCQPNITVSVWHVKTIAEFNFKSKITKYYTLKQFMSS